MLIRYSMLDSFLSCPMGFKRRYIDKIPDTEKSSALELGTGLHLAIASHFEGGNAKEIFEILWNSFKDTDMIYYRHGWNELKDLVMNSWLPNFIRLHAKKFENVSQEKTLEMPFAGHTLSGTYDMLSDYEGVRTLTDWKTSSRAYKDDKILKNPQMYIYSALIKHNTGELPKQLQYKVFHKDQGGIQTLKTELTEEKLALQMQNVKNIIKNMVFCVENNLYYHTFDCYCKKEI